MGLIRKTLSISTLGAIDFRSDKERTAAYTKATRKEARKQTKLMQAAAAPPPGKCRAADLRPGMTIYRLGQAHTVQQVTIDQSDVLSVVTDSQVLQYQADALVPTRKALPW